LGNLTIFSQLQGLGLYRGKLNDIMNDEQVRICYDATVVSFKALHRYLPVETTKYEDYKPTFFSAQLVTRPNFEKYTHHHKPGALPKRRSPCQVQLDNLYSCIPKIQDNCVSGIPVSRNIDKHYQVYLVHQRVLK
jgi:hypothetical protein